MTVARSLTTFAICAALAAVASCGKSEPEPEPTAEPPVPQSAPPPTMPAPEPVAAEPPAQAPVSEEPDEFDEFIADVEKGLLLAAALKAAFEDTYESRGELPQNVDDLGSAARLVPAAEDGVESVTVEDGNIVVAYPAHGQLSGGTIEIIPTPGDSGIEWDCTGGTLAAELRPDECR